MRSYRPVRLPLTTCTSLLTITRRVNTHFGRWSRLVDVYSTHRWSNEEIDTHFTRDGGIASVDVLFNTGDVIRWWHANWKWLLCDVCYKSYSNIGRVKSGTAICVEIRRSRACQEQIQHGISIRSWTCRHSEVSCQRCLPRHCIPGVFTYDQPNVWSYIKSKHWLPSRVASVPFRAYLHPWMYLLSCVNWMDENTTSVHRAHDQLNRKYYSMTNTRSNSSQLEAGWTKHVKHGWKKGRCLLQDFLWHK